MRKATHYKVSGVVETKPTNLPEGLEVMEVEVSLPAATLTIEPIHGSVGRLSLTETELHGSREGRAAVMMAGHGIFEESEIRKLRDFLNLILGNSGQPLRVIRDVDGDVWFELEPNSFALGGDHNDVKALQKARYKREMKSGYYDRTFDYVSDTFGPVVLVENTWE